MTTNIEYTTGPFDPDTADLLAENPELAEPATEILPDFSDHLHQANYHIGRAMELRRQAEDLEAVYDAEIARLRELRVKATRALRSKIAWHEAPVLALHAALLEMDPRRKTIILPAGVMRSRTTTKPGLEIADKAAVLQWALSNYADLCPPQAPKITDLNRVVKVMGDMPIDPATGQVVPGLAVKPAGSTFSIVPNDEDGALS